MHPGPAAAHLPPFSPGSAAQCDQQGHPEAQPQGPHNADYKTAYSLWAQRQDQLITYGIRKEMVALLGSKHRALLTSPQACH